MIYNLSSSTNSSYWFFFDLSLISSSTTPVSASISAIVWDQPQSMSTQPARPLLTQEYRPLNNPFSDLAQHHLLHHSIGDPTDCTCSRPLYKIYQIHLLIRLYVFCRTQPWPNNFRHQASITQHGQLLTMDDWDVTLTLPMPRSVTMRSTTEMWPPSPKMSYS